MAADAEIRIFDSGGNFECGGIRFPPVFLGEIYLKKEKPSWNTQ